jgi:signal transduction histidine kinase
VEVLVRDNGAGMDEDVQSDIFEVFFSTKEAGKGVGLAAGGCL